MLYSRSNSLKSTGLSPIHIILRYTLFGLIAAGANLLTQRVVIFSFNGFINFDYIILILAILCGTLIGLIIKFYLDQRWIFFSYQHSNSPKRFVLYSITGLSTTALFWGAEFSFWLIWQTHLMREVGAASGLATGYIVKYYLDRKYVFNLAVEKS